MLSPINAFKTPNAKIDGEIVLGHELPLRGETKFVNYLGPVDVNFDGVAKINGAVIASDVGNVLLLLVAVFFNANELKNDTIYI